MDPCDDNGVNAESMELQQKPLMVNLIKGLAKVHDYHICLSLLVECVIEVLCELNQLGLAAYSAPKSMLILKKKTGVTYAFFQSVGTVPSIREEV